MVTLTTWGLPLFDDTDIVDPLQTPLGLMSTATNTAITKAYNQGVPSVANAAARDLLFPQPAQGNRVYRIDLGYVEAWYNLYSVSNPGGRTAVGWGNSSETPRPRAWRFPRVGSDTDSFGAGVFANIAGGTISNAPPGDYLVTASAVVSNTSTNIGYFRVMAGGVNLSQDMRADYGGSPLPTSYTDTLIGFAGGSLDLALSAQVAAGTGSVSKNGTGIRAVYLGRSS